MFRRVIIFSYLLVLLTFIVALGQDKIYKDLTTSQFKSGLDSISGEVLIDVRTPGETSKGIIEGANTLDYFKKDFEKQVANLDPNKTYFLYCEAGGRSSETLELMKKLGFKEVYNLTGGFAAWKREKLPISPFKK
jgi:phage shock protein E